MSVEISIEVLKEMTIGEIKKLTEEVRNDIYSGQQKERDFRPNNVSTARGDNFVNVKLIPDSIRQEVEDKIFPFIDKYGYERINLSDYPFEKSRDLLA